MKDLKTILEQILKNTPNYDDRLKEMEVYRCWEKAVGERVAKHCWPVKLLQDGVLLVASNNNAWLQQLRYMENQILANLERELKARRVKQLRFKLQMSPSDS